MVIDINIIIFPVGINKVLLNISYHNYDPRQVKCKEYDQNLYVIAQGRKGLGLRYFQPSVNQ